MLTTPKNPAPDRPLPTLEIPALWQTSGFRMRGSSFQIFRTDRKRTFPDIMRS